jgi:ubiquinone/menaquinone biosynthesis C-methylase UbiE
MSQQEQGQLIGNPAELSERYMVPAIFRPWGADLVTLAAPQPGERVLDVACGTGVVARLAAPYVGGAGQVQGLDINAEVLAVARSLPPPLGASIIWHEGSAVAMPFSDAAFDLVLCQQGLQFFPDRPAALREMHRVLAPGGRVALSVWRAIEHSPAYVVLADTLERHGFAEVAASRRAPFVLGSAEEIRALLTEAGFQQVTMCLAVKMARFASPELFVRLQTTASVVVPTSVFARVSEEARRALIREVSGALRSYVDDAGLAFPMEAHVAVARA